MILQVKYSIWKKMTILLGLVVVWIWIAWIVYSVRATMYEKDINKKILEINQVDAKLANLQQDGDYKKYLMMEEIYKNTNHLNYAILYEYLNQLRNKLLSSFKKFRVNRFSLEVQPGKVIIRTATPNYNVIYQSWWMIDKLSKQVFVDKLNISEFRTVNGTIDFNINIKTK